MSNENSIEIIERDKTCLAAAVKQSIKEHLATLDKQGLRIYGYSLSTAEEFEIIAPCGVANTKPRSEYTYLEQYFTPDEWDNDSGEWGNKIFAKNTPMFSKLIDEFKAVHTSEAPEYCYDQYEMSFVSSLHQMCIRVLSDLRNEGVLKSETFLAVWVSDPNDWNMTFKSIRKLNSVEILDGWYGNNA